MTAVLKVLSLVCVAVCFAILTYLRLFEFGIALEGKYAGAYLSSPVVRFLISLAAIPIPQILYWIGSNAYKVSQERIHRNPIYRVPSELRRIESKVDDIQRDVKSILGDSSNDTSTTTLVGTTDPSNSGLPSS